MRRSALALALGLALAVSLTAALAREPEEGVKVGNPSFLRKLVSAERIEKSASLQFGQLKTQAQAKHALLPPDHPQNVRLRRAIREPDMAARHPLYPLLFDPQTAGGLLASVPIGEAEGCVAELRQAGYAAASVIGLVTARSGTLEPIVLDPTGETIAAALAPAGTTGSERPREAAPA